ncbi:hypothetical protein RhiirB3_15716 [Rhizophagus irregularis]|nr:hypothetical protein RhiirB3_15716 [Rhizophagus irregularis]
MCKIHSIYNDRLSTVFRISRNRFNFVYCVPKKKVILLRNGNSENTENTATV